MQDPCNPTPHHAAHAVHHQPAGEVVPQHPPGQVLGRIRRHGTHRIARRLHAIAGACPAGPPLTIGTAMLKTVAPVAAFAGLTTLASGLTRSSEAPASSAATAVTDTAPGGSPGALGVAPRKQDHHHLPTVSVPEPPSLTLLLMVSIGWIGLRVRLRRLRARA